MPLSDTDRKDIASVGYADPVWFCKNFLPHLFPKPIPWVHRGILAVLTGRTEFLWKYGEIGKIISNFTWKPDPLVDKEVPLFEVREGNIHINRRDFTLVQLPRGFAKTTIAGIAVPLYKIVYRESPLTLYISEAGPHARMQLTNVRRELTDNQRLIEVFGLLRPQRKDDEKWAEDFFETTTGVAMVARGRGAQVRGINHRGQRPKDIIIDDLEDKEAVETEYQRNKTREWAYGDLLPARDMISDDSTITALGTMLHEECLLETLSKDPLWSVVKFGARDKQGDLLWGDNLNEVKLEKIHKAYALAGQLHIYYLEYFNQRRSAEKNPFQRSHFIYAKGEKYTGTAIYIDPAISTAKKADQAVITVVSMCQDGRLAVRDGWGKRGASTREMIDNYFALSRQYNPGANCHGVESNAFQAALVHVMKEEMFRKKFYFDIVPVTHASKKTLRIMHILFPRFASGYVIFEKRLPELEAQLLDFDPSRESQKDDWPDSLAGAIALLDPYAAQAAGDVDLSVDTMEPLEEVLGEDLGCWA